ncbi:MAG: ACP S-malonyltransferase [bacterium]|nr:ACP S-malonyltransferase [bacterium]
MLSVVFPGQGSQAVGMSMDFVRAHPRARAALEEADAAYGGGLIDLITHGPEEELLRTEITQPAVLAASIAIYREVEPRLPVPPGVFAGHSLGEYSALVAAGGLDLADAVRLVRRRGALMQQAVPEGTGAMAAILGLSGEQVSEICAATSGVVSPANYNSPVQTVIAGERAPVASASKAAEEAGAKRVVLLAVSAPFHCKLMAPAMEKLTPELAEVALRDLRIPVVANVTAQPNGDAETARRLLREQVCAPVRWTECIQTMVAAGATVQLEVGPGRVLSGLAAKTDRGLARASIEKLEDLDGALERVAKTLEEGA